MESTVEVRQLKAFVALVEQGSVTAAAQTLGVAQSTMSEALSSLERALGTSLFLRRRGSHELVLTEAGNALLPHARSVLDLLAAAHVAVASVTTGARARVAIATNESLSTYIVGPQLDIMRRAVAEHHLRGHGDDVRRRAQRRRKRRVRSGADFGAGR